MLSGDALGGFAPGCGLLWPSVPATWAPAGSPLGEPGCDPKDEAYIHKDSGGQQHNSQWQGLTLLVKVCRETEECWHSDPFNLAGAL